MEVEAIEIQQARTNTGRLPAHVRFRTLEPHGVMALHASAVSLNGGALLFLGPPETGKSTMAHVMRACAQPLADDKVYLIPQADGKWMVTDATWTTLDGPMPAEKAATLSGPPLCAIFRLYRASMPHLNQVDTLRATHYLTSAFFETKRNLYLGHRAKVQAFATMAALAKSVRSYDLHFDRSPRTIKIVIQEIAHIRSTNTSVGGKQ